MTLRDGELTPEQKADKELTALYQKHPEAFKGLVRLWIVWDSLGLLGATLRNIVYGAAIVIGGYYAAKHWFMDWLLEVPK